MLGEDVAQIRRFALLAHRRLRGDLAHEQANGVVQAAERPQVMVDELPPAAFSSSSSSRSIARAARLISIVCTNVGSTPICARSCSSQTRQKTPLFRAGVRSDDRQSTPRLITRECGLPHFGRRPADQAARQATQAQGAAVSSGDRPHSCTDSRPTPATRQALYCRFAPRFLRCLRYALIAKVIARAVDRRHKSCSFKRATKRL